MTYCVITTCVPVGSVVCILPGSCFGDGVEAVLWLVHTASVQPSLSPLFPALPECAAALACVVGPVASTTPTRTKVRNYFKAVCFRESKCKKINKKSIKFSTGTAYRKTS